MGRSAAVLLAMRQTSRLENYQADGNVSPRIIENAGKVSRSAMPSGIYRVTKADYTPVNKSCLAGVRSRRKPVRLLLNVTFIIWAVKFRALLVRAFALYFSKPPVWLGASLPAQNLTTTTTRKHTHEVCGCKETSITPHEKSIRLH